jgi:Rrf2 family protein
MKTDYGLRALVELAGVWGRGLLQSAEIASRQSIPEPYLDQLLNTLRKAGIVHSTRGPAGGHSLARAPESITVTQVILALEGTVAPIACLDAPDGCDRSVFCCQREMWEAVQAASRAVTDGMTVAELAVRFASANRRAMYHI